jgi:hypothetical protein
MKLEVLVSEAITLTITVMEEDREVAQPKPQR